MTKWILTIRFILSSPETSVLHEQVDLVLMSCNRRALTVTIRVMTRNFYFFRWFLHHPVDRLGRHDLQGWPWSDINHVHLYSSQSTFTSIITVSSHNSLAQQKAVETGTSQQLVTNSNTAVFRAHVTCLPAPMDSIVKLILLLLLLLLAMIHWAFTIFQFLSCVPSLNLIS